MTEGCAVASVLGMPEEREAAARVRVEGLREEAARLAEVLDAAEIKLDRRVIVREELVEALALSADDCRDRSGAGNGALGRRRGRWCRPGRTGCRCPRSRPTTSGFWACRRSGGPRAMDR
jgi:hypothetical protein